MCASIDSSDSQKAPAAVLLNCVLLQWLVFKIPKSNNYDVEEGKTGKECWAVETKMKNFRKH